MVKSNFLKTQRFILNPEIRHFFHLQLTQESLRAPKLENKQIYCQQLEYLEEYRYMYVCITTDHISYLFCHSLSGDESNTIRILIESLVYWPCRGRACPQGGQLGPISATGQYIPRGIRIFGRRPGTCMRL
jgi:hypothetical protein